MLVKTKPRVITHSRTRMKTNESFEMFGIARCIGELAICILVLSKIFAFQPVTIFDISSIFFLVKKIT